MTTATGSVIGPAAAPDGSGASEPEPEGGHARATVREREARSAHVTSEQLFQGAAELQIEHRGAFYRLRKTSLGKLILTK